MEQPNLITRLAQNYIVNFTPFGLGVARFAGTGQNGVLPKFTNKSSDNDVVSLFSRWDTGDDLMT
jgi:hypothetical protein